MTKSEIVEALRCAADLCSEVRGPNYGGEVGLALRRLGWNHSSLSKDWEDVYGAFRAVRYDPPFAGEDKRHDLLEAAQRIEEGQ